MIARLLDFVLLMGATIVALPVATILLETLAAVFSSKESFSPLSTRGNRDRVGVLIPAHNEEQTLHQTLTKLQRQIKGDDCILVVADNCTDSTADIAKELSVAVITRTDQFNKGKGFALDFGIRSFAIDPPDFIIVVDADCELGDSTIDRLVAVCKSTNRPVQARYAMIAAPNSSPSTQVREFAWRIKNWIRPLGLHTAGLPCQLMGTGMAFPWEIIARATLATGALVEDLKLGLELAAAGHPPKFCPAATVTSEFPSTEDGSRSQQLRWERGHLGTIAAEVPGLLATALRRGDMNLFILALDASVPPLSLLWIIVLCFLVLGSVYWLLGMGSTLLFISLGNVAGFACTVVACWLETGRDLLPAKSIFIVAARALTKIPFYYRIMVRRTSSTWIRTDRRKL